MTIVVFDRKKGMVYSDRRVSRTLRGGKIHIVGENYEKIYHHDNKVFAFAGDCESIDLFFKKYKNGITKTTSKSHFTGCFYDSLCDDFTIISVYSTYKHYFYGVFFLILSLSSFYLESFIVGSIAYILYFVCLQLPGHTIKVKKNKNSNLLFFGSGADSFHRKWKVSNNSFKAISSVHIEDPYCNSYINSIPIDGRYLYEDTH